MAQSKQAIKSRIASVDSTRKITKAMQMVASSKLTKERAAMEANRPYARGLKEMMDLTLESAGENNPYLHENEGKPSFVFVVTSDMGMCGGYNANIYRAIKDEIKPNDEVIMIGSKGCGWAKAHDFQIAAGLIDLNTDTAYDELAKKMDEAIEKFENKEIKDIKILFTHYKNTLTFLPTVETLLPVKKPEGKVETTVRQLTEFEPSKEEMLSTIVPMASKNVLYSDYLESKTSEQASRRLAMENATDNADELSEQLELEYNRVRQSAITQEITEIVGGANALK